MSSTVARRPLLTLGTGVLAIALALAPAVQASAASRSLGSKTCTGVRTVETVSYSTGNTVHTQRSGSDYANSYKNGSTYTHRYWDRGATSVTSSGVETDLSLSGGSSSNYVQCTI